MDPELTLEHYNQRAVMFYQVSDNVQIRKRDDESLETSFEQGGGFRMICNFSIAEYFLI